jgi:putative oxidoreductase
MRALALLGRILYGAIFIFASLGHFSRATMDAAAHAGVPAANLLVPASGLVAFVGGVLILLGLRARLGAVLIIVFLVPVTLTMHNFWAVADPMQRQLQMVNFLKNTALLGGALYMAYFGSGPLSLDAWIDRREPASRRVATPTPA